MTACTQPWSWPLSTGPAAPPEVKLVGDYYELAEPVMAEVYVAQLLERDAFRRHCDRYRSRDAILANLG